MMRAQGGGSIVNLSSISAHIAQPSRWTYNAAKGAVNQLTRCMALDLSPDNIRVNTVSPGWIWTREVDKAAGYDRAKWGPIWGKFHMLRRLGEVEDAPRRGLPAQRRGQLHHLDRDHGRWRLSRHGLGGIGRGVEFCGIELSTTEGDEGDGGGCREKKLGWQLILVTRANLALRSSGGRANCHPHHRRGKQP